MSLNKYIYLLCAIGAFLSQVPDSKAEDVLRKKEDDAGTLTFALENDVFLGEDDGYTNGARLSWLSSETAAPLWMEESASYFPFFEPEGRRRYGFAIGQTMYAPNDLTQKTLIRDDRPYAGFLFGSAGLTSDTGYRLDNLQLTIGMVGPSSLAAQTQDAVHKLTDSPDPQGWDNQLHDELGIMLTYERKWRGIYEFSPFGFAIDVTPHLGASLGNVHTYASTGAMFRLGYDLPADYGPPLIRPSLAGSDFFTPTKELGWYLFGGFEGRAVAQNIFLDGNTFRDSHAVTKENFIGGLQAGAAVTIDSARIAYTYVVRSREFVEQKSSDEFAALTVSFRF